MGTIDSPSGRAPSSSVWMGASADAGPTPMASDLALPARWDEFSEVAGWAAVVEGEWLR